MSLEHSPAYVPDGVYPRLAAFLLIKYQLVPSRKGIFGKDHIIEKNVFSSKSIKKWELMYNITRDYFLGTNVYL